jgi:hypothetical protein
MSESESESESVLNNINEFYKLKNKYEQNNQKNKNKILYNPTLSWKERQTEFKKLKPKCINCKRPGGTAFITKLNKDTGFRELRSFCMATERCNLNIVIQLGRIETITNSLVEIKDSIQENKEKIIESKNLLLFNYIPSSQALKIFDNEKVEINEWTSLLEMYLEDYILLTDNEETKTKLNISTEKSYIFIQQIRDAIKQFKTTDDTQFVRDAVNIYITNLKPLLDEIQKLKYKENIVWFNEDNNTYHLLQNKLNISLLESGENNTKLIKFNVGFSGSNKSKIEESIGEPTNSSDNSLQDDIIGKPTFGENNTVTWSNKEYQKIWDKFKPEMKDALLTDKEWLQEFMDSCTSLRLNGKPCVFITPSNLIIPPQIIHVDKDGTEKEEYDFGNKVYNDLFNGFSPSYQDTLLKLYSNKDGVKNYNMLTDTLNGLLEQKLGFGKGYI